MNKQKAVENIAYIKEIIAESRRDIIENGIGYIFLGTIFFIGFMSTYIGMLYGFYFKFGWNWFLLIAFAWIVSFSGLLKKKDVTVRRTFSREILRATWISIGISLTIIGFIGSIYGAIPAYSILPIIAIFLGMAYMVSGIIYGYRWVSYLSYIWWVFSIFMFIYPGRHQLLLISVMIILLQIIPGIILYKKSIKDVS